MSNPLVRSAYPWSLAQLHLVHRLNRIAQDQLDKLTVIPARNSRSTPERPLHDSVDLEGDLGSRTLVVAEIITRRDSLRLHLGMERADPGGPVGVGYARPADLLIRCLDQTFIGQVDIRDVDADAPAGPLGAMDGRRWEIAPRRERPWDPDGAKLVAAMLESTGIMRAKAAHDDSRVEVAFAPDASALDPDAEAFAVHPAAEGDFTGHPPGLARRGLALGVDSITRYRPGAPVIGYVWADPEEESAWTAWSPITRGRITPAGRDAHRTSFAAVEDVRKSWAESMRPQPQELWETLERSLHIPSGRVHVLSAERRRHCEALRVMGLVRVSTDDQGGRWMHPTDAGRLISLYVPREASRPGRCESRARVNVEVDPSGAIVCENPHASRQRDHVWVDHTGHQGYTWGRDVDLQPIHFRTR